MIFKIVQVIAHTLAFILLMMIAIAEFATGDIVVGVLFLAISLLNGYYSWNVEKIIVWDDK